MSAFSFQGRLTTESNVNGDMIFDNFTESYLNLTIKTLRMLKWVNRHCGNVRYMVKIDDDVYLNTPLLLNFLLGLDIPTGANLIAGHKYKNIRIDSDPSSKWYTPHFLWVAGSFPDFVGGFNYILGSTARADLYHSALNNPLFHLEDVFLTGMVRESHLKVGVVDIPEIYVGWNIKDKFTTFPCHFLHNIVTIHSLTASEIKCYRRMEEFCQNFPFLPLILLC